MNPFSIGAGLLGIGGSLFGGHKAPQFGEYNSLFGPAALAQRQKDIFGMLASSPGFRQALAQTNVGSQQASQAIDKNLANAGLSGSGVGGVASGLGQAAGGFNRANLIGGLSSDALSQAFNLNQLLAGLYQNFQNQRLAQPSGLQQGGAALLGALGPGFLGGGKKAIGGSTFGNPFGMGSGLGMFGGNGYFPNPMSGF